MAFAPPVSNGKFSFSVDSFYVSSSSGNHLHRRASPAEIQAVFQPEATTDPAAHWYEAQLIHYGLAPSKTKSVAKMRLFDAVNGNKLVVLKDIQKIEADMKKEWRKREKAARDATKDQSSAGNSKRKRKAEEEADSEGHKRAKQTARRGRVSPKIERNVQAEPSSQDAPRPPRTKQTARRSGGFVGSGRLPAPREEIERKTEPLQQTRTPRTKQTARRSGGFVGSGRHPAPKEEDDGYDVCMALYVSDILANELNSPWIPPRIMQNLLARTMTIMKSDHVGL